MPMPTSPDELTLKSVVVADAVEEPMAKSVVLAEPLFAWMENLAHGDVVAMPTLPVSWTTRPRAVFAHDAESVVVVDAANSGSAFFRSTFGFVQ